PTIIYPLSLHDALPICPVIEKSNIAVIILTYNESIHLPRALDHVRGFAREIFVIDSFSTDNTVELAKAGGAQVLLHPFQNYARQDRKSTRLNSSHDQIS